MLRHRSYKSRSVLGFALRFSRHGLKLMLGQFLATQLGNTLLEGIKVILVDVFNLVLLHLFLISTIGLIDLVSKV